jgi:hypothetical protein
MSWDNLVDTLLNVMVFVFIGVLIWLYLKEVPDSAGSERERKKEQG